MFINFSCHVSLQLKTRFKFVGNHQGPPVSIPGCPTSSPGFPLMNNRLETGYIQDMEFIDIPKY